MNLIQRVQENIIHRRQRILDGKINCIPTPIPTFKYYYPGVEKAPYYLVSGAGKSAKSKTTNFLFVFNPILYAFEHQDLIRLQIFYALLEETAENITLKFICYLLYIKYGIRVDIKTLKSVDSSRIVSQDILEKINSLEIQAILHFFEEHVVFIPDRNPTGIYNTLKEYAERNGTTHKKFDARVNHEIFDFYEPNDPEEYVMCVVDHVSLISTERQMDLRESIKKLSEYMKIIRNKYGYIPVIVQQQNSETISLEAYKANKITPTQKGCADSQDPPKDCDMMIGITNPDAFDMKEFKGYNITKLGDSARFINIPLGRDSASNVVLGLYFDGATGFYKALPKPDDVVNLSKVYELIRRNKESTSK